VKTIIIHIGIGKTGTTSLQQFLNDNREPLKEAGFLYPLAGNVQNAHHDLCCLGPKIDWQKFETHYTNLLSEINSTNSATLISSEYFSYTNPELIKFLKHVLSDFTVRIIFYARPQLDLIESAYIQWHKVLNKQLYGEPIFTFFEKCIKAFDFNEVIKPWEIEFGQKSIQSSLYHKDIIGSDICQHFLNIIGITDPEIGRKFMFPKQGANPSLHPLLLDTLIKVDKIGVFKGREAFVEDLLRASQKIKHIPYSFFTPEQEDEIRDCYRESNGIFADKYLSLEEKELLLGM